MALGSVASAPARVKLATVGNPTAHSVRHDVQKLLGTHRWYPCNPGNACESESNMSAASLAAHSLVPSKATIDQCEPWYLSRGAAIPEEVKTRRKKVCFKIGSWHEQMDSHDRAPARIPAVPPIDQHLRNSMLSRRRAATPRHQTPVFESPAEARAPPRAATPLVPPHVAAPVVATLDAPPPRAASAPPAAAPDDPPELVSAFSVDEDWLHGDAPPRAKNAMVVQRPGAARGKNDGNVAGQAGRWNRWKAIHQRTLPQNCFLGACTAIDTDVGGVSTAPSIVPLQSLVPKKLHARLSEKLAEMRQARVHGAGEVPSKPGNDRCLDKHCVKSATYKKGHAGVLSKLLLQRVRAGNLNIEPPREAFFQAW